MSPRLTPLSFPCHPVSPRLVGVAVQSPTTTLTLTLTLTRQSTASSSPKAKVKADDDAEEEEEEEAEMRSKGGSKGGVQGGAQGGVRAWVRTKSRQVAALAHGERGGRKAPIRGERWARASDDSDSPAMSRREVQEGERRLVQYGKGTGQGYEGGEGSTEGGTRALACTHYAQAQLQALYPQARKGSSNYTYSSTLLVCARTRSSCRHYTRRCAHLTLTLPAGGHT